MVKHTTKSIPKQLPLSFVILGILVLVLAVVAIGRGSISDRFTKIRTGMQVRQAFSQERQALSASLKGLGMNTDAKVRSACVNELVYGYNKAQLQCTASQKQYVVTSSKASIAKTVAAAADLDNALEANGWTNYKNAAPSYKAWFSDVLSGKNWLPDEPSYKNTDHAGCNLEVVESYSKPNPPAYTMTFSCTSPNLLKR